MADSRRKRQVGTVIRDKNDKTIVVGVSWLQRHPVYGKQRRRLTKLVAHDESNTATIGDRVLIEESKPVSRSKRWRLVEIVDKVEVAEVQPGEIDPEAGAAVSEDE